MFTADKDNVYKQNNVETPQDFSNKIKTRCLLVYRVIVVCNITYFESGAKLLHVVISGTDILDKSFASNSFNAPNTRSNSLLWDYLEATYFRCIADMSTTTEFHGYTWNLYNPYLTNSKITVRRLILSYKFTYSNIIIFKSAILVVTFWCDIGIDPQIMHAC